MAAALAQGFHKGKKISKGKDKGKFKEDTATQPAMAFVGVLLGGSWDAHHTACQVDILSTTKVTSNNHGKRKARKAGKAGTSAYEIYDSSDDDSGTDDEDRRARRRKCSTTPVEL